MGEWVVARRTPLSLAQARELVTGALVRVGIDPSRALPLALAQLDLESGSFTSIYTHNVGNLKPGSSWDGDWYSIKVSERDADGNLVWYSPAGKLLSKDGPVVAEHSTIPPGHPQTRFRSYENDEDGFFDWAKLLTRPGFAEARAALIAGDVDGFLRGLKRGGYYTATLEEYSKGFRDRLRKYLDTASVRRNRGSGGAGLVAVLFAFGTVSFFLARRRAPQRRIR